MPSCPRWRAELLRSLASERLSQMDITHFGFDLTPIVLDAHRALVGKIIVAIEQGEYTFKIRFTDGSILRCSGHTYDGNSLDVEFVDESDRDL